MFRLFSDLYLIEGILVLLGPLEGALESLLRIPLPTYTWGVVITLTLLVDLSGAQSWRLLVHLQFNIDCLAPDLVLLFEDDLVREWADEIGRLQLLLLLPLARVEVPRPAILGLVLPFLFPYIHDIIVILLPRHPLFSLILYNYLAQFLPELIFCYSWLLHPTVFIDLLDGYSSSGVRIEHHLDQVFETLVQFLAILRLAFAEMRLPEKVVLPRAHKAVRFVFLIGIVERWVSNGHDEETDTEREYVHFLATVSVSQLLFQTLASESLVAVVDFRGLVASCPNVVRQDVRCLAVWQRSGRERRKAKIRNFDIELVINQQVF